MSNNKKIIIGASVILFAAFVSAGMFQNETQAQEPLVVPDATVAGDTTNQKGRDILDLLADLKKVRLDDSIFSDPTFQALQDLSVELISEPKGRPNPFAPLGKDAILDDSMPGLAAAAPRDIPFSSGVVATTTTTKPGKVK